MRTHRIVSRHFPSLFDDLEGPTSSSPVSLVSDESRHIDEISTQIDCVDRHPTNQCQCKITAFERTHCANCVPVPARTPTSIQYVSEAVDSSDLPTTLVAPVFPTGVNTDTPTGRTQRSNRDGICV